MIDPVSHLLKRYQDAKRQIPTNERLSNILSYQLKENCSLPTSTYMAAMYIKSIPMYNSSLYIKRTSLDVQTFTVNVDINNVPVANNLSIMYYYLKRNNITVDDVSGNSLPAIFTSDLSRYTFDTFMNVFTTHKGKYKK